MEDKKLHQENLGVHQGGEINQLEHGVAPESTEGTSAEPPHQLSPKTLFGRPEMSAFYQEALDKYGYDGAITAEQEKRLARKIDWHILPLLGICYAFYYIDKTTLSYAALFGLKNPVAKGGLGLHGTQYSWLSSAFYFGWLVAAIPSNLAMQRSPTSTYLAVNIMLWGALLMCQAAIGNFGGLLALRVLGGAVESIADPAFMLITTTFYTRAEQPSRISIWYMFNGVGVGAGGLLGYAIGQIKGSLASWKFEFIVVGAVCLLWGAVLLFILPSNPATTMWLTRDERLMAIARLRGNQTGIENKKFKWDQCREAFTDHKTWLFFALGFIANIPNGGISNFSTLIFQGLGFDKFKTSLLGIPQGAFVVFWIGSGAYLNSRLPNGSRTWVCAAFMAPTIAGGLGFLLAPKDAYVGRLMCFYLTGSYQATFVLSLSLITSNTAGQTKKMIVSAMIWLGACIGNIVSPFFYLSSQAPTYRLGIASLLTANCIEVLIILALRYSFIHANKKRDRKLAEMIAADGSRSLAVPHENETTFSDLTDGQNPNFRYVY